MSYDDVLAVIPCRRGSKRFPGKNTALFQGLPLVQNTIRIAKAAGIKNDDVLAVIPCRRGSKRFPGKNTALFQGLPLVQNTIRIAKAAGIKNIVVTSNSEDVLNVARFEKVGCLARHESLCTDDARMEDVVDDAASRVECDTICLLQVTSPLLRPVSLQSALDTYFRTEAKSLTATNLLCEPCGAFYIVDVDLFIEHNRSFYQEGGGLYTLSADQCVDVDYPHQLQIANLIAAGRRE